MDRTRSEEPESVAADPALTHVPPKPAVPGGEVAAKLQGYQASGGNQMVVRLLAAAQEAATEGPSTAESIEGRLGGGSPLPADVRAEAEAGFGAPLGDVRLHTDAPAASLATGLNAHAFTTGNDVFFNSGQYDPGSRGGYEVLVHELAHTLQQSSGPVGGRPAADGLSVSEVHDPAEHEARSVAARMAAQRDTQDGPAPAEPSQVGDTHSSSVQRSSAGNRALTVQRHSSFEHTLLGNARPDEIGKSVEQKEMRDHLLEELRKQIEFFAPTANADPRQQFPDVRWVQLFESGLWVSYGELNALPDYLSDPMAADRMPEAQLIPVLQKMRSTMRDKAVAQSGGEGNRPPIEGRAKHWKGILSDAWGEVEALDAATAQLGPDRYKGLLARNACHFAPFSWRRWEQFHNQAAEEATLHHKSRLRARPLQHLPAGVDEHARNALLNNAYADHFLQDSFAAGHLVNKTLIMQFWVDWLNDYNKNKGPRIPPVVGVPMPRPGQPNAEVLERMGTKEQPGVAGREAYARTPGGQATSREDRRSGRDVTDPQTAEERKDPTGRRKGSGVTGRNSDEVEKNYQAYLELLNNSQAQFATKAVHDYFNEFGLKVVNGNGVSMQVGGDDTLMSKSDKIGAQLAAEASRLSRQAIDDLLHTGQTQITTEQIFAYVPIALDLKPPLPLEQWHDTSLRKLCDEVIFPTYYEEWLTVAVGRVEPELVSEGISRDAERRR